jgi:hypothetical protein
VLKIKRISNKYFIENIVLLRFFRILGEIASPFDSSDGVSRNGGEVVAPSGVVIRHFAPLGLDRCQIFYR